MQQSREVPTTNQLIDASQLKKQKAIEYADSLYIAQYDQRNLNKLEERASCMDPCPLRVQLEKRIKQRKIQLNPNLFYIPSWQTRQNKYSSLNKKETSEKEARICERKTRINEKERSNLSKETSNTVSQHNNISKFSQQVSGLFLRLILPFKFFSLHQFHKEKYNQTQQTKHQMMEEERQQLLSHSCQAQQLSSSVPNDDKFFADKMKKSRKDKEQ